MTAYKYMSEIWKKKQTDVLRYLLRIRAWEYRQGNKIARCTHPTRPDKARRLGYKAKQGVVVVRTRVRRGGLRKGKVHMKRKPSKAGVRKITMGKNIQRIAEERCARHYPNLEVLNSYWVGQDGKHKYYEVILIDTHHPAIIADKQLGVFSQANGHNSHRGRAARGLTSAGKRGRGLSRSKGKGAEKLRPSLKANLNRGK